MNNEWGDFQTPLELARLVLSCVSNRKNARILEPTCGVGNFLSAARELFPEAECLGIEVHEDYAQQAEATGATVLRRNIFDIDLGSDLPWGTRGPLLVVGNPPWVTNANLTVLKSSNLPRKSNVRNLRGMDAMTGASNFDIAEFIWLKLISEIPGDETVIALLCKTHVARSVLEFCRQHDIAISDLSIRRIDAKRWFDVSVDACLFMLTVGGDPDWRCSVYDALESAQPSTTIGFGASGLVADIDSYSRSSFADGKCQFEWRQGVKHDASAIMELNRHPDGSLTNGEGELVDIEDEFLFPLLKATNLHRGRLHPSRMVVVTQRALDSGTSTLDLRAPKLWHYLARHSDALDNRKSSIYRARPRFAMFGIGEYTFAPWKVAVSGMHSPAEFRVLGPHQDRPVLLDDTSYFLPFQEEASARMTMALLQSKTTVNLLKSLTFPDAKRPVTKRLLRRIDLRAVLDKESERAFVSSDASVDCIPDLERYRRILEGGQDQQSPRALSLF